MTDLSHRGDPQADARPEPPLDRTISPIAGRLASAGRSKAIAFAGLLVGCGAVALATWSAEQPRAAKAPERPARQVVAFEPAKPGGPTLASPGADPPTLTGAASDRVPAIEPLPGEASPPDARAGPSPAEQARRSPIMAYSQSSGLRGLTPPLAAVAPPAEKGPPVELDGLRRGSTIGRATAQTLGDRNFLILAGATIPCTLQTAIDTTAAGYVTCLIGNDIYSDNGAVVLLEKGARVLGEYRTGMRQGQARVFVLWLRAVTPAGVAIALSSPASDGLGRAGFGGTIDTHFWDRFGAGLLLSVVGNAATTLDQDGRGYATTRLPSDAAAIAVEQGADIPPTLRKAQGSEVAIQVAQDLDFSNVYALRARR